MRIAQSNSYVLTSDAERLIGASRRKVEEFANKGILNPFGVNAKQSTTKRWTLAQTRSASDFFALKRDGMTMGDIADLVKQGHLELYLEVERTRAAEARRARRAHRSVSRYLREQRDTAPLIGKQDYYLRYIPQRYCALVPILENNEMPGKPGHIKLITEAVGVVRAAGWCHAGIIGFLESFSEDGRSTSPYAYIELAAKPDPAPSPTSDIDSGCYAIFGGSRPPGCEGNCETCLRSGGTPSDRERFSWNAREQMAPDLHKHMVAASSLAEPYPTGPWSSYTRAACGVREEGYDDRGEACSVLPRIMPQETPMPLGITACVLPPAVYLCSQYEEGRFKQASGRMCGLASVLASKRITREEETATHKKLTDRILPLLEKEARRPDMNGKVPAVGLAALAGWFRELESKNLLQLSLLLGAALEPEDGYCVICEELPPRMTNDAPRYEAQILLDKAWIAPPPPTNLRRRFRRWLKGFGGRLEGQFGGWLEGWLEDLPAEANTINLAYIGIVHITCYVLKYITNAQRHSLANSRA